MLKIEPEEKYGNYVSALFRVIKETSKKIAPKFVTAIPDLSSYDVVLIGFPTWAQDMPVFVAEFLNKCDLKGKNVFPFATFGVGGIDWNKKTLERVCKDALIKAPFNYGLKEKDDYEEWIASIK
jgi:flavorubredoxin